MARRRGAPVGALIAVALVPAFVLAGVWQYADANVPAPTTTTTTTVAADPSVELTTDLFSYRRHPSPLAQSVAETEAAAITAERAETLADILPAGSCLRIVDDRSVLSEAASDTAMVPASNQKLLIAAAALEVLGAESTFVTEVWGLPPVDGVVAGDIYVVGGGDPVLTTEGVSDPLRYPAFNTTALESLADELLLLGVTAVDGDVIGDGSRYDDEFRSAAWGDDITTVDVGPIGALLVNDGLISEGNYGLDPSRAAARTFYDVLRWQGASVGGVPGNGPMPAEGGLVRLAAVESLPLVDVLVELLHTSDNTTAEMLVKELGYAGRGDGSWEAGLAVVGEVLERWGVPIETVELSDGSGLSRFNRVSCSALTYLLTETPVSGQLIDLLPVAGRDGTLADQLLGTAAEGQLRAKTGTLTGAKAFSGVQPAGDRRPVTFSVVLNGDGVEEPAVYLPVWEAVVDFIDAQPVDVDVDVEVFGPR